MKAAARTALVPALVLCAALTAAPEAVWAGEELLAPFPGASSDGGGRTTQAAPTPPGATAASPVAPAGPTAAGDETAKAAEGPAVAATAAGPAATGTPTVSGAPEDGEEETEANAPAGGSRLLRALAETAKAPGSADDHAAGGVPLAGTSVSGTSVFAAEGCPRALLRRLLAGAAGEADALSALGIESEILTLCRERQEILVGLFEAEAALRELRTPPPAPMPAAAAKPAVAPPSSAPARRIAPAAQSAAPSPLRAALASTAEKEKETEPQAPARVSAARVSAARVSPARVSAARVSPARVSPARVSPRYAWFSIVGTAGALRAGVTDGSGVWFVREGDALPGGVRVAAIAGRPPAVRIADAGNKGEATLLPYRARPGEGP